MFQPLVSLVVTKSVVVANTGVPGVRVGKVLVVVLKVNEVVTTTDNITLEAAYACDVKRIIENKSEVAINERTKSRVSSNAAIEPLEKEFSGMYELIVTH